MFANGLGKGESIIELLLLTKTTNLTSQPFNGKNRFSQGWTREGALNPSEIVLELEDFVGGEMASHITSIFGANRYNQLVTAAQLEVQKKRQD